MRLAAILLADGRLAFAFGSLWIHKNAIVSFRNFWTLGGSVLLCGKFNFFIIAFDDN